MSYCRFAWDGSDCYVYESDRGFECCGCAFGKDTPVLQTPEAMIVHLAIHRRAGHFVPEYAITGLWAEIPGAAKPVTPEPEEMTRAKALMKPPEQGLEVRLNSDGSLDEVVAPGFHLEQMSDTGWWMRISSGKLAVVVNLFTKGRRERPVLATWEDESEEGKAVVKQAAVDERF